MRLPLALLLLVSFVVFSHGQSLPLGGSAPLAATAPAASPAAAAKADSSSGADTDTIAEDEFLIDGVPYAKVLYLEGRVWIRPPGESSFHRLTEDEPIPAGSVLYTGYNGTLDFALAPGMATRMVPFTALTVASLPQPATTPAAAPTGTGQLNMKTGTVFSALGREDGAPIDYKVSTPEGVAGARGTMFATSAYKGNSQVDMLHGTVNFETPDHQTSQISAGQSQRVTGAGSGKFSFGGRQALSPGNSETFFGHAGGLLEHASGGGVVRRGLGPDVARTLGEHGYKLPDQTRTRLENAGHSHQTQRPAFDRSHYGKKGTAGENHAATSPERSAAHADEERKAAAPEHADTHPGGEREAATPEKKNVPEKKTAARKETLRDRLHGMRHRDDKNN